MATLITRVVMAAWLLSAVCLGESGVSSYAPVKGEDSGYVEVRKGAYLFWWLFPCTKRTNDSQESDCPLVIWFQGGPGASGCGFGNFEEIGPRTLYQEDRKYAWTEQAHVLFIDNPVGSGFSYVNDQSLLITDNQQMANDMIAFFHGFAIARPHESSLPTHIVVESYGGKYAVGVAKELLKRGMIGHGTGGLSYGSSELTSTASRELTQRNAGSELQVADKVIPASVVEKLMNEAELKVDLRGIALGDVWVEPMEIVQSWYDYLQAFGLGDDAQLSEVRRQIDLTQQAVDEGEWELATWRWGATEAAVGAATSEVDWYYSLRHTVDDVSAAKNGDIAAAYRLLGPLAQPRGQNGGLQPAQVARLLAEYRAAFSTDRNGDGRPASFSPTNQEYKFSLYYLMNYMVKPALGTIPEHVYWGHQSSAVFSYLGEDFMKPVLDDLDYVLSQGMPVTVYNGQLDLICCTLGAYKWVSMLHWPHIGAYLKEPFVPIILPGETSTEVAMFHRRHKNLEFYSVLKAGHMVPTDVPQAAALLLRRILDYQSSEWVAPIK